MNSSVDPACDLFNDLGMCPSQTQLIQLINRDLLACEGGGFYSATLAEPYVAARDDISEELRQIIEHDEIERIKKRTSKYKSSPRKTYTLHITIVKVADVIRNAISFMVLGSHLSRR